MYVISLMFPSIPFQFDGQFPPGCHQGDPNTILFHTYNALYVRDSSFLLSACMIDIKMENDWKMVVCAFIWYFWSCDLSSMHLVWVPMQLCLPDDQQAVLMINRALRLHGFCLSFNLPSGLHISTNQKQATRYSAHGFQQTFWDSQMTFFSRLRTLKQATTINGKSLPHISIMSIMFSAD